jgi:drug/metabolite transporter (DMT)-like permease
MLAREVQLENALCPMLVTLLGMLIEGKLEHPLKAPLPIVITLEGMFISVRAKHPRKAFESISLTPYGIYALVGLYSGRVFRAITLNELTPMLVTGKSPLMVGITLGIIMTLSEPLYLSIVTSPLFTEYS